MKLRRISDGRSASNDLPQVLLETLDQLDSEVLLLSQGNAPLFATEQIENLNLIKDGKLQSAELLAIVGAVRRSRHRQTGKFDLPRGPIGDGRHELTVSVSLLGSENLILVLIRDESDATRIDEMRRDFIANISHELKTPIGALSLLSEAVLGAKDDPDAVTKFATRMQAEAKRLTDLVQDIINLSRLQDSDPLQIAQECSVDDLISEAIFQCEMLAQSRGVDVTAQEINDVVVMGDREQLIMAIHNLIENAVNYSPEGTKVAVTSTVENRILEISVTDQGIGIPMVEQSRVFERFYRIDPARSRLTGGTGLGLSIVKHVAAKHGGEVKLWSVENIGSTFSLRLPITNTEEGI